MNRQRLGLILAFCLTVSAPLAAMACPNCYASTDRDILDTYYLSTSLLTLLPFGIVGVLMMVARHFRESVVEESGLEAPLPQDSLPTHV